MEAPRWDLRVHYSSVRPKIHNLLFTHTHRRNVELSMMCIVCSTGTHLEKDQSRAMTGTRGWKLGSLELFICVAMTPTEYQGLDVIFSRVSSSHNASTEPL